MKIAVIGTGKTGSHVLELAQGHEIIGPFNSQNPVTSEALRKADVGIVFTTGEVFLSLLPELLQSNIPLAIGSTGFEWTYEMREKIENIGLPWIYATNFSLGMNLVRSALKNFSKMMSLLDNPEVHLSETHHIHKKDRPSGTALSWKEWVNEPALNIESIREGDVKGLHELTIETEFEKIHLSHEAKDRALFAKGALWAAQLLVQKKPPAGLYEFQEVIHQIFIGEN